MKYKDWLNEWLTLYIKFATKERTYKKYQQLTQKYLIPHLGEYGFNELSAQILQGFTVKLLGVGISANTVNGIITVVKSSIKKAVILGIAKYDFSDGITRPKIREKKIKCFTLSEQRKIEAYINNSKNKKLFGILFCLYTGLRIGELLALKWKDFDLNKGIFTVMNTCMDLWQNGSYVKILLPPKTETSYRIIPIPKQLLPRIKELKSYRRRISSLRQRQIRLAGALISKDF